MNEKQAIKCKTGEKESKQLRKCKKSATVLDCVPEFYFCEWYQ
jgi:hypothetical protein